MVKISNLRRLTAGIYFIVLVSCLIFLEACLDWQRPKRVIYEGRVVEAFNSQLPLDSVAVYLCEGSVFPLSPIPCSFTEDTLSNESGYFYLEAIVESGDYASLVLQKDGYQYLDSCIELSDGTLECYLLKN